MTINYTDFHFHFGFHSVLHHIVSKNCMLHKLQHYIHENYKKDFTLAMQSCCLEAP